MAMLRIVKGNTGVEREKVSETVDKYLDLHKEETSVSQRMQENSWLVKKYYDMATGESTLPP